MFGIPVVEGGVDVEVCSCYDWYEAAFVIVSSFAG